MHLQIVITLLSIRFVILEAFRTEVIRGYPCVRRNHQLYCPTPGKNYPNKNATNFSIFYSTSSPPSIPSSSSTTPSSLYNNSASSSSSSTLAPYSMYYTKQSLNGPDENNDLNDLEENVIDDGDRVLKKVKRVQIDNFIDENKSLIRRMFGEYNTPDDEHTSDARDHYASYSTNGQGIHKRHKRARSTSYTSNKVDSCESAVEIVTPYWASNSAGKIRAIVNTQHLQQAIQQEVCQSVQTKRCNNDCSCEQKYKWHRLLAYDPDDDCKGIFMDWFLFPSCCVCRCTKLFP